MSYGIALVDETEFAGIIVEAISKGDLGILAYRTKRVPEIASFHLMAYRISPP